MAYVRTTEAETAVGPIGSVDPVDLAGATRSAARGVYVRAWDPEASLPGGRLVEQIRAELAGLGGDTGARAVDGLAAEAEAWAAAERERFRGLLELVDGDDARGVLARRAALGCAPLGLVSGAWLQWLSDPANADDAEVLRVLWVYATDVGAGHPRASRGNAYLAMLRRLGRSEFAVPPSRLTLDQRIPDAAFHLPGVLLAMSRRPDDFRPEILGADLCLRAVRTLPALAVVEAVDPAAADWRALDPADARHDDDGTGAAAAREVRALVDAMPDADRARAAVALRWALSALARWSAEVHDDLDAARHPGHEMAELLRLRAREGAVYHHSVKLHGRLLSDWLKDCQHDPAPLLEALATSRLLKPGRSQSSALVNGLIDERGPMFRVFAPEDVAIIRRWIDALPARGAAGGHLPAAGPRLGPLVLPALGEALEEGRPPADLREAYFLLHRRADTVALRRFALAYVHGWLRRSRHGMDGSEMRLPAQWGPEGLRPWLVEQHDRAGQEFEDGLSIPLPSREELVDSTVQLAPLTLIDGSWLRGFTDYDEAASEIGHSLFETYWDELGNGEVPLNHPLIYREVLDEMGVHVPPTGSIEFARWPGFRDASFELPVYWLCIGRFPRTFLPEVLGLNLAMELSGVGGTYRRGRMALQAYGFSTRFVDIHNTIDNVASGHSAWAADAVDTYMASIPESQSGGARAAAWERVRTGYRSLNPPSGFWARFAGRTAQLKAAGESLVAGTDGPAAAARRISTTIRSRRSLGRAAMSIATKEQPGG